MSGIGSGGRPSAAQVAELVERLSTPRNGGEADAAQAALIDAFTTAKAAGDLEAMATVALSLPMSQRFGAHPGPIPAVLHEAFVWVHDDDTRCRLAATLARSCVYGGDAPRALSFAEESVRLAAALGSPERMADALDAALASRWGPDDFSERVMAAA